MRVFITILFFLPLSILAQESLSLEQAKQYALEHNRTLQMSQLNIDKAKQIVRETIAIGLPQVNASVEYNNFLDIPVSVLPDFISPSVFGVLLQTGLIDPSQAPGEPGFIEASFGTSNTMNAGVSVSQLIFDGSYLVGLQSTKVFLGITEIQSQIESADVSKVVAESYYTVLIAQENTKTLEDSKTTLESTLEEITALYQEGLVKENDVDQLQLTITRINSSLANAKRQVELAKKLLKLQLGMRIDAELSLSDNLDTLMNNNEETDPTFSLDKLPEYKLINNNIRANELLLKNQKVQYLPSIAGFFSHAQSAQRNEFNFLDNEKPWFPNTLWGIKLQLPIFSSGMKHARVKKAKIDLEMALISKEQAEEGLTVAAHKAQSDYVFAKDNLAIQKQALALSEKIRTKTLAKYKEGLASSFELNQIESQYLESQGAYLLSTLNLLKASEAYKRAYGN